MKVTIQNGNERTITIENGKATKHGKQTHKHGKKPVNNAETFDEGILGIRSEWNYKIDNVFRAINRSRLNAKSAIKGHIPFSTVKSRNVRGALTDLQYCCGWIIEGEKNNDAETKTVTRNEKSKDKNVVANAGSSITTANVTNWIKMLNDIEDHVLDVFHGNPFPNQQSQFESFVADVKEFRDYLSKSVTDVPVEVL